MEYTSGTQGLFLKTVNHPKLANTYIDIIRNGQNVPFALFFNEFPRGKYLNFESSEYICFGSLDDVSLYFRTKDDMLIMKNKDYQTGQNENIFGPVNIKHISSFSGFIGLQIPTYGDINSIQPDSEKGFEHPSLSFPNQRNETREKLSTEENLKKSREQLRKMDMKVAFIDSDLDNVVDNRPPAPPPMPPKPRPPRPKM